MKRKIQIDELNTFSSDSVEIRKDLKGLNLNDDALVRIFQQGDKYLAFRDYFEPMDITESQKDEREDAAEDIFDAVLLFLTWCENAPDRVIEEETQRTFQNMYKEVIFQYCEPDDYLDEYVPIFIKNLIDVTLEHQGEDYYTSVERAAINAVNEANTVLNHADIVKAKEMGYTQKTWISEVDERTRNDHLEMNGWTVPIDEWFIFDDCMMLFPHDEVNGSARQTVNCRCSVKFS